MQKMREQYHRRRDFIVRRFNEIGLKCHLPRGSFYAFPDISATGLGEKDFAVSLLQAEKVAMVPGTAFGVGDGVYILGSRGQRGYPAHLLRQCRIVGAIVELSGLRRCPKGRCGWAASDCHFDWRCRGWALCISRTTVTHRVNPMHTQSPI